MFSKTRNRNRIFADNTAGRTEGYFMADLATTIQTALSTQTTADERIECRVQGRMVACLGPQEIINILNGIDPDQDIPQIFRNLIDGVSNDKIHLKGFPKSRSLLLVRGW